MRALVCAVLMASSAACGSGPAAPDGPAPDATLTPVAATADWPASTPEAEGLDRARLGDLALRIRRGDYGRMHSLLIARNGRLAVEDYFSGWSAAQPHTMQAVSKSVTSLLVGLAVQAGRMRATDPVTGFFPSYAPLANFDGMKAAMTVNDMLTMRSGLAWQESSYPGSPLQQLNDCRCDWLRFVLDWPMRETPGTRWEYVSGATILLGGIVGSATGARLDQFADTALFGPLGATGAYWARGLPDGLPHAGGGLYMRPRDMAKIGVLAADGGRWQGTQIVNASWIAATTAPVARGVRSWGGRTFDYGGGWWMCEYDGTTVIAASGARGQWIFAVPRDSLVVALKLTGFRRR